MSAHPPDPDPTPLSRTRADLRSRALTALRSPAAAWVAGGVLAAAVVALAVPSFGGWHSEDDFRSMRWVLEYRDRPWVAVTELHALHDHVRPATLLATWAGAQLADGGWGGPHAVLVALHLAAMAGLAVLAARLGGSRWAGVLALLLGMTVVGSARLPDWNAWICSAGELAFGLWGLVALHAALQRERWPWLACGALIVAGLFKEPGWVVYPLAGAVLVGAAWRAGRRRATTWAGLAPLPIGAVGLAICWHPANVYRSAEAPTPLLARVGGSAFDQLRALVDLFPLHRLPDQPWWAGISGMLLALAGVAVARRRGGVGPAVGAVVLAVGLGVMLPFEGVNEVQVLSAGYGLALATSCALVAAVGRGAGGRIAAAVLALGVVHEGAELVARLARPGDGAPLVERQQERDGYLGIGAFARAVRLREARLRGELGSLILAPMLDLEVLEDPTRFQGTVLVDERVEFAVEPDVLARELLARDLIGGRELPLVRDGRDLRRRPRGRFGGAARERSEPVALELDGLTGGFYALGVVLVPADEERTSLQIRAEDGCGGKAALAAPPDDTDVAVRTLRFDARCGPLRLSWSGAGRRHAEQVFFAPLPPPKRSLRRATVSDARVERAWLSGEQVPTIFPDAPGEDSAPPPSPGPPDDGR